MGKRLMALKSKYKPIPPWEEVRATETLAPPPLPAEAMPLPPHPDQGLPREDNDPKMVAAPPSRRDGTFGGYSSRPGRYTISKQENEIAMLSGISAAEYVKQKLIMEEMKRKGQIQS